jgi:hypothetical protein
MAAEPSPRGTLLNHESASMASEKRLTLPGEMLKEPNNLGNIRGGSHLLAQLLGAPPPEATGTLRSEVLIGVFVCHDPIR